MFPSGCILFIYNYFTDDLNTSTIVTGVDDLPYFIAFYCNERKSNFLYTSLFTIFVT